MVLPAQAHPAGGLFPPDGLSLRRLDDLCDQLVPYPNFLRPHRSFLINMEYIANIAARSITMQDGAEVPVPHGKYSELKNRYLSYIFDRKKAVL